MRVSRELLTLFVVCCYAVSSVSAVCPDKAANIIPWSQWAGAPSKAGDSVTVGANDVILLDVSPPTIQQLDVYGTLVVSPTVDITLGAYFVYVHAGGHFWAGSLDCPLTAHFEVVLYGEKAHSVNPALVGTKVFGVYSGGNVDIHGVARKTTWSVLDGTVNIGDNTLTVSDEIDWAVGETIVLAGTDFYDSDNTLNGNQNQDMSQSETVTITAVTDKTVTFTPAVKYTHWGVKWTGANGDEVDTRGEVGLLTRNIVVRGDISDGTSDAQGWGGHLMFRDGGQARLSYIEVTKMGQLGELGRYPIHYHNGSVQNNSFVLGCAIHDTYQRSITVHSTFSLTLRNNVAFRSRGHMYFIEDGNEEENVFDSNLGINPLPIQQNILLNSDSEPSVFWITNPNNHFYYNHAAEGKFGFWYSMPVTPLALSASETNNRLRNKPNGDFIYNHAHGNHDGIFIDRGQENSQPGDANELTSYNPTDFTKTIEIVAALKAAGKDFSGFTNLGALDEYSASIFGKAVPATFIGFTAWKNIERGMWGRGERMWSYGGRFADNMVGCAWPGQSNLMQNTVFVGETDNVGFTFPKYPDYENGIWWGDEEGRSRPYKYFLNASVVGYSSYDASGGDLGIDINFHNYNNYVFASGSIRRSGAISGITGPNVITPANRLYGVSFDNVDNRFLYRGYEYIYQDDTTSLPSMYYDDAVKGIVWVDSDGSMLKGTQYENMGCGARIVGTSPHLTYPGCVWDANWVAHVCPGNYHAIRSFSIFDTTGSMSPTYNSYLGARAQTDLHIVRLQDGVSVDVEANFQQLFDQQNNRYGAIYTYGTNLIMNQDYYISVGQNQILNRFQAHLSWFNAGEWIRLAIPVSSAPSSVGAGWDGNTKTTQVNSKSELVENSWYYDAANQVVWLHFTASESDTSYDYMYGMPIITEDCLYTVVLYDSNDALVSSNGINPPTGSTGPSGPMGIDQCLSSGVYGGVTKVTESADTAPAYLFNDAWVAPWGGAQDDYNSEWCSLQTTEVYEGTSALSCTSASSFAYMGYGKAWGAGFSIDGFTHIQFAVKSAAGVGSMKLAAGFGHCNEGQNVVGLALHAPTYTGAVGINEDDWTVVTVPLTDYDVTTGWAQMNSGNDCGTLNFQVLESRPVQFYLDSVRLVQASTSIQAQANWPPRPTQPGQKGPGPAVPLEPVTGGPGPNTGSTPAGPTSSPDAIKEGSMSMVTPSIIFSLLLVLALLF